MNLQAHQRDGAFTVAAKQTAVYPPDFEASGEDSLVNGGPWPAADVMTALSPREGAAKSKRSLAGNGKGGELSSLSSKAIAVGLTGRKQGVLAPESAQTLHHAQS